MSSTLRVQYNGSKAEVVLQSITIITHVVIKVCSVEIVLDNFRIQV